MEDLLPLLSDPEALAAVLKDAYVAALPYIVIAGNAALLLLRVAARAAQATESTKDDEVVSRAQACVSALVSAVAKTGAPANKAASIVLRFLFPALPKAK